VNKEKFNFILMMDWYSNYPAPSKDEAIREVTLATGEEEWAREIIMKMPSLGSYTGWYAGFKGDVIKEINEKKENREEERKKREEKEREIKKEKEGVEYVLRKIVDPDFCI
jgi:hypothetical protein